MPELFGRTCRFPYIILFQNTLYRIELKAIIPDLLIVEGGGGGGGVLQQQVIKLVFKLNDAPCTHRAHFFGKVQGFGTFAHDKK